MTIPDGAARKPRILFVGMQSSPHVARWIETIADRGWDLHLFPVNGIAPNDNLCGVTLHRPQFARARPEDRQHFPPAPFARSRAPGLKVEPFSINLTDVGGLDGLRAGRVPLGVSGRTAPLMQGPGPLAALIRELQPDVIHSLEFQHAGYLTLQAKQVFEGDFPIWIATNWGSDIFHFGHDPGHRTEIERMLAEIDFYSCECHRDIMLARDYGYRGPLLPVLPNTGGFDLDHIDSLRSDVPPSQRRCIMVKGYQHFAGRGLTTLDALTSLADQLKGFEIILYSIGPEPLARANQLISDGVLNIRIVGWASHDEMLTFFAGARLYVGTSVSDAISTSVLEAMAMGAFPIQTNTSCCEEWFDDGVGGFVTTPHDIGLIRDRILAALNDDALVDHAARINADTVSKRLDRAKLAPRVGDLYAQALKAAGVSDETQIGTSVDLPEPEQK